MKARHWLLVLVAGCALFYGGSVVVRAWRNLVTLNVRNMEVRQVVRKVERQTWETILVHTNVQGKVTLNVRNVPLEEVLRIIGDQTASRSETLYPLYKQDRALANFMRSVRGEIDPAEHGWTNLQVRGFFRGGMGGPGGPFGGGESTNSLISLDIQQKDISLAVLALNRFGQTRVVAEDGTKGLVSLRLEQATARKAVRSLAKAAQRSWTTLYSLRGEFGFGGPGGRPGFGGPGPATEVASAGPGNPDSRGPRRPELTEEQFAELRKQREAQEQELRQTLPAAEQQRLAQAEQQRQQQFQEMQNLTPEQRRERFMQMGGRGMDTRNLQRIKNTTPEQRSEQYRRIQQMRQRFQQRQDQPPPAPAPR